MVVKPVKAMKYMKNASDNFLILFSLNTLKSPSKGFEPGFLFKIVPSLLGFVSGK